MIKGVNKRIIEINNPESIYFEKAIFYLKPEVRELPAAVAESEVRKYISRLGIESCCGYRHSGIKKAFLLLIPGAAAAVGIILAFVL